MRSHTVSSFDEKITINVLVFRTSVPAKAIFPDKSEVPFSANMMKAKFPFKTFG